MLLFVSKELMIVSSRTRLFKNHLLPHVCHPKAQMAANYDNLLIYFHFNAADTNICKRTNLKYL